MFKTIEKSCEELHDAALLPRQCNATSLNDSYFPQLLVYATPPTRSLHTPQDRNLERCVVMFLGLTELEQKDRVTRCMFSGFLDRNSTSPDMMFSQCPRTSNEHSQKSLRIDAMSKTCAVHPRLIFPQSSQSKVGYRTKWRSGEHPVRLLNKADCYLHVPLCVVHKAQ